MTRWATLPLAALTLTVVVSAQGQGPQQARFVPPRLKTSELPPLPAPTVSGGGEVLIEAFVDRRGMVTRPAILRATAPYTHFVLDAIARWQFEPARDIDYKGLETTVDVPVIFVAIYLAPILTNAPTVSETPREWSRPSGDSAYPIATATPNYPPQARDGGVVLFELSLNEAGVVTDTRGIGAARGFEAASREALASWRFRGGQYRARPVASTAYVLFGFRSPVGLPQLPAPDPNDPYKPKPDPDPYKPKPTSDPYKPKPDPDPYKPEPNPDPYTPKPNPEPYKPDFKPPPQKPGAALSPPSFGILSFR